MNTFTHAVLSLMIINSFSFATTTITGAPAQQLYQLLNIAPVPVERVSVKNFAIIYQCHEKDEVTDAGFHVYSYVCVLPNMGSDGRITLPKVIARSLFEELEKKGCVRSLKTLIDGTKSIRRLQSIECHETETAEHTEYKCTINPKE